MIDYVLTNWWLSGLLFYAPMALCLYGYTIKTWKDYQLDTNRRDSGGYYSPSLTVGVILGRAVVSICPIANLFAATFDVGPKVFSSVIDWLGRVFDCPLVPARKG